MMMELVKVDEQSEKRLFIEKYISEIAHLLLALYPDYKMSFTSAKILLYFKLYTVDEHLTYKTTENFVDKLSKDLDTPTGSVRACISMLNSANAIERVKYGIYKLLLDFDINIVSEFDSQVLTMRRNDGVRRSLTYQMIIEETNTTNGEDRE